MTLLGAADSPLGSHLAALAIVWAAWAQPLSATEPAGMNPARPPRAVSYHLRVAQDLALSRLRHGVRCRALFEAEGVDGAQLLNKASFRLATAIERSKICLPRRAVMFTTVRGSEIGVCLREFRMLAPNQRAALLLHEVLHHAGVSEQPLDPDGLSSHQLTRLVETRCRL